MRLPGLALALATLVIVVPVVQPAEAGAVRAGFHADQAIPPSTGTPSALGSFAPSRERRDRDRDLGHHQRHFVIAPTTVFVTPTRCWQPGYWTYQFVPQSYAYNAWVPGHWLPDGQWIDGYYAPGVYSSGYYQPLWVEGYYTACD